MIITAEVLSGLGPFAREEIQRAIGQEVTFHQTERDDELIFRYAGRLEKLAHLRTVTALYLTRHYRIPRPRALLGDEHLRSLLEQIQITAQRSLFGAMHTFRISAAGKESGVFSRLRSVLAQRSGLTEDTEDGEMLIRVVPVTPDWKVLTRLSPRPLSARPWRVCNWVGAANATIAAAAVQLAEPHASQAALNVMCGSGTFMIEHSLMAGTPIFGVDHSTEALCCARSNVAAAQVASSSFLTRADAMALPFTSSTFEVLYADLPWGERIGSRAANRRLYGCWLHEMARVARPGARLVLLTQDSGSLAGALEADSGWSLQRQWKVFQGGYHPWLTLCRRN